MNSKEGKERGVEQAEYDKLKNLAKQEHKQLYCPQSSAWWRSTSTSTSTGSQPLSNLPDHLKMGVSQS